MHYVILHIGKGGSGPPGPPPKSAPAILVPLMLQAVGVYCVNELWEDRLHAIWLPRKVTVHKAIEELGDEDADSQARASSEDV